MLDWLVWMQSQNITGFWLLFVRLAGVMAFFPFFDNNLVPVSLRGALSFFLTLVFYPTIPHAPLNLDSQDFLIALLSELLLGLCASFFLHLVFSTLAFATDTISFSMGLTMASAYDPISGAQKAIVGQVVLLLAILIMLQTSMHHFIILWVQHSLERVPLGSFSLAPDVVKASVKAFAYLFSIGFSMAFPILALIMLSDIVFGMIMKTHPQFNLLAIGFPLKIAIAFIGLIMVLGAMMHRFKDHLLDAFQLLSKLF
ncbi:flagellar biosynthetic protein FliR [Helicobacter baculiformis]|uniref:Flagellar biosynthetic protein FliR n=1 Tax=Helicobacter baculiformis TaxID=427351 RepID=A0ABV7ZL79_9HELI|nr:flagellar biosynthetic protein FliR [Helicobacter baculiformis]